jgi:hypothetical protein
VNEAPPSAAFAALALDCAALAPAWLRGPRETPDARNGNAIVAAKLMPWAHIIDNLCTILLDKRHTIRRS